MSAHLTAALAALRAAPNIPVVYDGMEDETGARRTPDAALPYLVVHAGTGRASAHTLCGDQDRRDVAVQVTAVGGTAEAARVVAGLARDVLTGRLTVAGRSTWRGVHQDDQPARPDEDVTDRTVYYAVDRYTLSSVPG